MSETGASLDVALVTRLYPNRRHPQEGAFVKALATGLVGAGARVSVIFPRAVGRGKRLYKEDRAAVSVPGRPVVVSPRHLSFSDQLLFGVVPSFEWSARSFARAAGRAVRGLPRRPSILYAHFLYPSGFAVARLSALLEIPAVVALGESDLSNYERYVGAKKMRDVLSRMKGVLSVSEENAEHCRCRLGVPPEKIMVVPNAADTEVFYPRDRAEMRRRLGLASDVKIVAFVGHFNERKGPLRLLEAMEKLPWVRGVFLGEGAQVPRGPQVLFAGPVAHWTVPDWLSAADVLVFPSLAEGSPNAVIEAMACGLPVVASDIPALRETVDASHGVLVPAGDIEALTRAMERLLEDEALRSEMSKAALQRARTNSLDRRAQRIRDWLDGLRA